MSQNLFDALVAVPPDPAALDPALQPYLEHTATGLSLRSPFVYQVPFFNHELANRLYHQNRPRFDEAVAKDEFETALMYLERPYRMAFLVGWWKQKMFAVDTLQQLLPFVWTDTEFPRQFGKDPLRLFRAAGYVSDTTERLPDTVTVYRGCNQLDDGIAWTLDLGRAKWFARRFAKDSMYVQQGTIAAKRVHGYFTGRGEAEVVLDPKRLRERRMYLLQPEDSLRLLFPKPS